MECIFKNVLKLTVFIQPSLAGCFYTKKKKKTLAGFQPNLLGGRRENLLNLNSHKILPGWVQRPLWALLLATDGHLVCTSPDLERVVHQSEGWWALPWISSWRADLPFYWESVTCMKATLVRHPGPVSIPPKAFDAGIDRKKGSLSVKTYVVLVREFIC